MATSPYSTSDLELLREIEKAAEQRLEAQLTAGLAADQRALVFAGLLGVAAAALASGAVSILADAEQSVGVGIISLITSVGLLLGMGLAIFAARPAAWYFPGGTPKSWESDIASGKDQETRLQELVKDYDERIEFNEELMAANGKLLFISGIISFSSLLIGLLAYIVFRFC